MSIILGIDTGGTYTDGIILDSESRKVLCKAKALTTKENLSIGIENCISKLDKEHISDISLICLSTTLATNAVVEDKGSKVGLIMMNADLLHKDYAADRSVQIKGYMDIRGDEQEPLDESEIRQALKSMKGSVDALAVSGYASVRNPKHELRIKEMATELLNVPVVCGHELTSVLGYDERTVTAVLNAKLISNIQNLVIETRKILEKLEISAQIMIVKGDGNLMTASFAEGRPIDTVMSGPAASVIGSTFLSDIKDAIIVDIGGTTTDIADLTDGVVRINEKGSVVGNWRTRARAIEMHTHGLGGDSYLRPQKDGSVFFGPERVEPLCVAAFKYPNIVDELKKYKGRKGHDNADLYETDCYRLLKKPVRAALNEQEERVLIQLEKSAHSIFYLEDKIGKKAKYLKLDKLEQEGYLQKISLTPTDLLHASGEYDEWNSEASCLGVEMMAERLGMTAEAFIAYAKDMFVKQIAFAIAISVLFFDNEKNIIDSEKRDLIRKAVFKENDDRLGISLHVKRPIIGLGAPVAAWLPKVCSILDAEVILPENREVANAIGAAAGDIRETIEAEIKYNPFGRHSYQRFSVYSKEGVKEFMTLEEGRTYARELAERLLKEIAEAQGLTEYEIYHNDSSNSVAEENLSEIELMDVRIRSVMVGKTSALQSAK